MNAQHTPPPHRRRRHQQGFTLVELSIAVLIGLFLLGGLLTVVQDMRRTFGAQNTLSQLQDNERLAMTLIADVIQAAGYYPDPAQHTLTTTFTGLAPFNQAGAGQVITGTHNAGAPGDSITVQFNTAPNDGVINCKGKSNISAAQQIFINTFSVNGATGQLLCTLGGAAGVALIDNVTNLQILYGVKRNLVIADNTVDTFLNANQMAPADWGNVICVKVTLTFKNNVAATQPGQPLTIDFQRVVTVMSRAGANTT